ncbi:hypothetical protein ANN_11956 [Periplaneta americana]|uniref:Uncharacterized protein n=1 Tax=Periplaneta americana TaxID=6978 RepID=A0ABQ8T6H5_PERAM|nr:hypothetical protein ANN_11956 [Periplaneta americana]
MAGLCEGGNEPPGSLKAIDELNSCVTDHNVLYCNSDSIHVPLINPRYDVVRVTSSIQRVPLVGGVITSIPIHVHLY